MAMPNPEPHLLWGGFFVLLWLGVLLLASELVYRFCQDGAEIARKIVHIGAGHVILIAWWQRIPTIWGVAASLGVSLLTLLSYRYPLFPSISGVGRKSWGTFFYALSMAILIAVYWPQQPAFAILGILIMTWGDGLAALVGKRFGRHPYVLWGSKKSWEGSLTMAGVSSMVTLFVLWLTFGWHQHLWLITPTVGVAAMALETFSWRGVDNLTVPLGSATLCFLLTQWLF